MTAEIVVVNAIGVALAADSAVTIGSESKVYTSADKLFLLSNSAPIGIMIYGNSNFVGVPWETIIKAYRAERRRGFATVREYAKDFLAFLTTGPLLPLQKQRQDVHRILQYFFYTFMRAVDRRLQQDMKGAAKKLSTSDIKKILDDVSIASEETVKKRKNIVGLPRNVRSTVRHVFGRDIEKFRNSALQKLPISAAASRRLASTAVEVLVRECFKPGVSGVVVAGFGTREYMPAFVSYRLEGMIEGHPRFYLEHEERVDSDNHSFVRSFAQGDMVHTFMEGIDPDLLQMIEESTRHVFAGAFEAILHEVKSLDPKLAGSLLKKVGKRLSSLLDGLIKQWQDRRREDHWGTVMDVVSVLPKDELAAMAEAMVNLTKFKRRVSAGVETVGGPIDVAVITKGDGFVWVKRKHYFEPSLNPRVISRLTKEIHNG
jgi:hypothetical protein